MNPVETVLNAAPICILDGALATELERKGFDLDDPLWSAKILMEQPEEIAAIHESYLKAGADCIITASYQATIEGYLRRGFDETTACRLIASSVTLARDVRDRFWDKEDHRTNRPRPLVAASVGPYGAYLADGSEYRGDYGLNEDDLMRFHNKRLQTLIAAGPDILACETLPCLLEAKAIVRLVAEHPGVYCWVSFSARDGKHTSSGDPLLECAGFLNNCEQVAAIGINCTAPEYVESLIDEIRAGTDKPIIVYPNSGERYDVHIKAWKTGDRRSSFSELAARWYKKGARIIGGCCRTGPDDIRDISNWSKSLTHPGVVP